MRKRRDYSRLRKNELINIIRELNNENIVINKPGLILDEIRGLRINYSQENFILAVLNGSSKIIKIKILFKGGVTSATVDQKIIFQEFFKYSRAASIIIAHNHPGLSLKASSEDDSITDRIQECCQLFNINFLDHIIFTEFGHMSYANSGKLKEVS